MTNERDLAQGVGFFRSGGTREPTKVMVAFVDADRGKYGLFLAFTSELSPHLGRTIDVEVIDFPDSGRTAMVTTETCGAICRFMAKYADRGPRAFGS